MKIEKVYVEFGGDPSDDKECYKRYCSTEPFDAVAPAIEVIPFVAEWKYLELKGKLDKLVGATNELKGQIHDEHCDEDWHCSWCESLRIALSEIEREV